MERVLYDQVGKDPYMHYAMGLHLQAYSWAYQYCFGKTILDAACGTGFGTMIYSLGAKKVIAVDKDEDALNSGKKLKRFCPVKYMVKDLDKDILPEADICVSVETIEHLNGNGFFLQNLKVNALVFSIPIAMPGEFHKLIFKTEQEAVKHLKDNGWNPVINMIQKTSVLVDDNINGMGLINTYAYMGVAERSL